MKTIHTHKGTCQSCGRVQAVDNKTKRLAKHGYTVSYGSFQFVCRGSKGEQPAEFDVTLCRSTMKGCLESAIWNDSQVVLLKDGTIVPETFQRWNPNKVKVVRTSWGDRKSNGDYDTLPIELATATERRSRINAQIHHHELEAEGLRAHEAFLRTSVLPRFQQPLYVAAELDAPKPVAPPVFVDVKKAKVVGTFATKQARKDALDKLSRLFDVEHRKLSNLVLSVPHAARTEAMNEVYYGPMQLSHWRSKHSAKAIEVFPQAAALVATIEELVKARKAVKAAP